MYYGRGAGKLPTASAVVSDVVDCARHIGKTIMCFWDDEDVLQTKVDNIRHRFFVRTKAELERKAVDIFGLVRVVVADVKDEYAFVTEEMSEKEFAEKAQKLGCVWNRIRLEG